MSHPLAIVDAFTAQPFRGNPAAVCLLNRAMDDDWMQQLAAEMNLSETAFIQRLDPQDERSSSPLGARFGLRWFTPAAEVELCGHATLASAHLLYETGEVEPQTPITFHTRHRGLLTCRRGEGGRLVMDFPADPAHAAAPPPGLLETLGVEAVAVSRSRYDWLIELPSADAVRQAGPEFRALARFETRGIALTARGDDPAGPDVVSRFFAPRLRIDEDPVTGSLHCVLGPYWGPRVGRRTLWCHQASARGGDVWVTVDGERVGLAGHARTVVRGQVYP